MKTKFTLILALMLGFIAVQAQPTINCNTNINISLDLNGQIILSPDMILEDPLDPAFVSVTVSPTTFDCSDIGPNNEVTITGMTADGSTQSCLSMVTVEDKLSPTAVVDADVWLTLDASGSHTITAADIDEGSWDNCGIVSYDFSPSTITCDSPNPSTVVMTIADASGNTSQAWTDVYHYDVAQSDNLVCAAATTVNVLGGPVTVTLDMFLDSGSTACPSDYSFVLENNGVAEDDFIIDASDAGQTFTVTIYQWSTGEECETSFDVINAGVANGICVYDFDGNAIADVEILTDKITDETGCVTVEGASGMTFTGTKADEVSNGVDEVDLMLMREHILGKITLEGEQLLAADLTNNNGLTTYDYVLLEKALEDNNLDQIWKFVDGEFNFETGVAPYGYNQYITIDDAENYTFLGVKMGDLDLSYDELVSEDDKNSLAVQDIVLNAGETYLVDVLMTEDADLVVANIFFPALTAEYEVMAISSGIQSYTFDADKAIKDGQANFRWLGYDEAEFGGVFISEGDVLFTIEIKATANGVLNHTFEFSENSKDSKWKKAEALKGEHLKAEILNKITVPTFEEEIEVIRISPNPAAQSIKVTATGMTNTSYRISDMNGRQIQTGIISDNNIINIETLNAGVFILELNQADKIWKPQMLIKK